MTSSPRQRALLTLALALTLSACGPGGGGGGLALEDVGAVYGDAYCSFLSRCDPVLVAFVAGEQSACAANTAVSFEDQQLPALQAAIAAGTVVYDSAQAESCVAAVRGFSCTSSAVAPAACEAVFVGQVAAGGSCNISEECAGDASCDFGAGTCPGSCVARLAEGADCSAGGECGADLSCSGEGVCARGAGTGEACNFDSDCAGSGVCRGAEPDTGTPGTCASRSTLYTAGLGESCDFEATLCTSGLSCAIESVGAMGAVWSCAEGVGVGEACSAGLPDPCPTGNYCNADLEAGEFMGTCVSLPGAGQPGAPGAFGGRCAAGLSCGETETCESVARLGGACSADGQCASGDCSGGVCVAPECG